MAGKNPKPNEPKPKASPPPAARMALVYMALIAGAVFLMQQFQRGVSQQRLSYSQFKQWVKEKKVAEVSISAETIQGKLKPEAVAQGQSADFLTVRVEDEDLVRDLTAHQVQFTGVERSFWREIVMWGLMIVGFVVLWGFVLRRMGPGEAAMTFGKSRAKMYMEKDTRTTFTDVAGVDEAKEELQEVIQFLKTPERFRVLGGRIPKGVLLVGPPGTGKTMLAKAVAGESKVPFFSLSGSDFVEMFVGVGASRVRDLFDQATKHSPCIVFIDELDALGKARGLGGLAGSHDEREQTLNQLLVEMDGFDTNANVIIMAATNRPEILDPALLRPGRFDRQVLVDRPDINGREAILKVHAKRVKLGEDVDLRTVAARTPGFVGADLANVVNEAALLAAREDKQFVERSDFEAAIDRIIAGLEKKTRVMNELEKKIVAYHESGHALVAGSLSTTDPVHKVSIIPRGIAALGYTLQLPTEDRYLMTRQELQERLTVLLGGRVAEEIIFGEISTGAQNDLQRATDMARSMVTEYGMSDRLGPLTFGPDRRAPFDPTGYFDGHRAEYSQETAQQIDEEVRRLITAAHEQATQILTHRRATLEEMATRLLEKEVLEGEEVEELLREEGRGEKGGKGKEGREGERGEAERGEAENGNGIEPRP